MGEVRSRYSLTVVTPWLEHHELAADYLAALDAGPFPDEVIVVDNGGAPELPGCEVMAAGDNLGFVGGSNLGLDEADTDAVLFHNNTPRASRKRRKYSCAPMSTTGAAPTPVFGVTGVAVREARPVGSNHLRLLLEDAAGRIPAIGFDWADRVDPAWWQAPVDVAFQLQQNEWRGDVSLQARIVEVRPAG